MIIISLFLKSQVVNNAATPPPGIYEDRPVAAIFLLDSTYVRKLDVWYLKVGGVSFLGGELCA